MAGKWRYNDPKTYERSVTIGRVTAAWSIRHVGKNPMVSLFIDGDIRETSFRQPTVSATFREMKLMRRRLQTYNADHPELFSGD